MQKWEYLTVEAVKGFIRQGITTHLLNGEDAGVKGVLPFTVNRPSVYETLDSLGKQGWELVTHAVQGGRLYYTFKRPKQDNDASTSDGS